jgi:hypothetical protein
MVFRQSARSRSWCSPDGELRTITGRSCLKLLLLDVYDGRPEENIFARPFERWVPQSEVGITHCVSATMSVLSKIGDQEIGQLPNAFFGGDVGSGNSPG